MTSHADIRIADDVTPEYAPSVLEHYVTQFYQGEVMVRELYYSPDNSMVLVLKQVGEQWFPPWTSPAARASPRSPTPPAPARAWQSGSPRG